MRGWHAAQAGCICLVTELMDQDLHTALRRPGGRQYLYHSECARARMTANARPVVCFQQKSL